MMIMGFMFINIVNLRYERKNPFKGSDGTYKDFKIMLVLCIVLFFTSGIVVLRHNEDLKSYCEGSHRKEFIHDPAITNINTKASLHKLFMSIDQMNYSHRMVKTLSTPGCHEYSAEEVFSYNYFIWTLGYIIGL